jgi:hypothetical protein
VVGKMARQLSVATRRELKDAIRERYQAARRRRERRQILSELQRPSRTLSGRSRADPGGAKTRRQLNLVVLHGLSSKRQLRPSGRSGREDRSQDLTGFDRFPPCQPGRQALSPVNASNFEQGPPYLVRLRSNVALLRSPCARLGRKAGRGQGGRQRRGGRWLRRHSLGQIRLRIRHLMPPTKSIHVIKSVPCRSIRPAATLPTFARSKPSRRSADHESTVR